MSTGTAPSSTTTVPLPTILTIGLAVLLAVATAVVLFTGVLVGAEADRTAEADPRREMTRAEVLDRLYRINGVTPPESTVPANVR